MKLKCFGIAEEIIGSPIIHLDKDNVTVSELRNILNDSYPELNNIKHYMVAVNHSYALEDDLISGSEEVAIIPPVSGG